MKEFSKKLEKVIPVTEKCHRVCRNGIVKQLVRFKNKRKTDWSAFKVPYVEETIAFLQKRRGYVGQRLLLVCDDENIAVKAAAYIKEHHEEFRVEIDEYFDEFDDYDGLDWEDIDSGADMDGMLRIISLNEGICQEKTGVNSYVLHLSEVGSSEVVLFTGLSKTEDMQEKIETIGACPASIQCIQIRPDQMQEPWVQELMIDYGCDVLELSKLEPAYYEGVLEYLLHKERYRLSKDVSTKMIVRKISKRRGRAFKEEDIAWYLDKAVENAEKYHPQSRVLGLSDFKTLKLQTEKPLEQLMKMTGLKTVKEMAGEAAALAHEETSNQKLELLHKNMLFLGNPGTGKTTCAKLLADIMAEEGNSNAVFVVAARRDLIGEYVGHTAPKVARKFEDARGGILFVDEAGFFLNQNSGGYVSEALKEFVRYMELYPDVTVIFAMYPQEAKAFLELDAGLASRISRFVTFEDYSNDELSEIAESMLKKNGYTMDEDAKTVIKEYMDQLRKEKKKDFGNAREARKIAESAIIAVSLQHYRDKSNSCVITKEDMQAGCQRLQQKSAGVHKSFGFSSSQIS